ncbi:hypothetical protein J3R30DRAFT_3681499 [Lentinula aciculospora]|uniref:Ubiquitin-like protease family profile domain-containing protein n=1 Tax=Lentinula aciculospora TaxID=153920 RepID=A0A9W9DRS8_9AGAR|nr:hypothetical protein J3R30DRAFT_3681499 [Lentinula aciculospora]
MAAGSVSASDRQAISSLSHLSTSSTRAVLKKPPTSLRDASTSSENSRTQWKQAPTPIPIPSNNMFNPYTTERFKTTIHSNSQDSPYGNRQRQQTLVGRSSKRQKTTHGAPLIAKEAQPDVHLITDEDDPPQAGPSFVTRPHPKPINLRIAPSKETPVTTIISDDESDNVSVSLNKPVSGPPDGDNSTWLQRKVARRASSPGHSTRPNEIEDISEFSDQETKPGKLGKAGFVKEQARKLDRNEQANQDRKTAPVPHLDLKMLASVNVKNGMKSRSATKPKSNGNSIDPIATSSINFVTNNPKAGNKYKMIPLKEIYFGHKYLGEGYRIVLKPPSLIQGFIIEGPENYSESVTFAQSVKSIEIGDTNFPDPCIKFTSKPLPPGHRHTGIGGAWKEDFTPGEPGWGEVTLKIDTNDPNWSPETFSTFRALCKRVIKDECREVVGSNANLAQWSFAKQTAGAHEDDISMEAGSDPLNNNIREEDVFDYEQLPVSNERYRKDEEPPPREVRTYTSRKPSSASETHTTAPVVRRSTRQQQIQVRPVKKQPSEDPDEIILSYPPAAATGAVKITNGDYNRLLPDEYLNDTLIEFGLKLWHHELATENPELADQIHVFNSFFYKKLNKKNLEEGYQSVKRWTSKFDIFSKKFVIVPINENMHWYLAIIYQPELVLLPPPERELPKTRHHTRSSNVHEESVSNICAPDDTPSPAAASAASNEAEVGSSFSKRRSLSSTAASSTASRHASPSEANPVLDDTRPSSEADAEEACRGLTTIDISVDIQLPGSLEDHPSPSTSLVDVPMDVDEKTDEQNIAVPSFTSLITASRDPRDHRSRSMDVDEDQLFGDDEGEPVPPSHSKPTSVPPYSFYAVPTPSRKGKEKAIDPSNEVLEGRNNAVDLSARETAGQPTARIFTLDSLGNKHPKVINILGKYLQLEAVDKKQLHNTSKALGRNLPVPTQPNFCDCGIYLIHFAQVFVKKAEYLSSVSQKKGTRSQADRNVDWEGQRLNRFRDELRVRVSELSKTWKTRNSPTQEQQEQQAKVPNDEGRRAEAVVHDLSDSDIDIVETTLTAPREQKPQARNKCYHSTHTHTLIVIPVSIVLSVLVIKYNIMLSVYYTYTI